MSRPGELTAAELTPIGRGVGTKMAYLGNVAAAWFFKTDDELEEHFGFRIQFRSTGAYRTNADTAGIPGALPDGDHERGEALDFRNYGAYLQADRDAFERILDRNGWQNIDAAGNPFPSELWHRVNKRTTPPTSSTEDRRRRTWHS